MISMQYNISLPSDYDMEIIKNRVQRNGNKTDGFTNLIMKAYLIAEKGSHGNYENQYAPFYLWEKEEGMNKFLLGGPFNNILNSFGRPMVNNWMVLHEKINKLSEPQFAIIQTVPIPVFADLEAMYSSEAEKYSSWIADPATKAYITGYNPKTWELCYFHMSTDLDRLKKIAKGSLVYDVHHIS